MGGGATRAAQRKEVMSRHYQELKGGMNKFRSKEGKKLQALILNSGAAAKDLDAKLAKAEKLLRLSELNRKMETETEKVAPFYASVAADGATAEEKAAAEEMAKAAAAEGQAMLEEGAKEAAAAAEEEKAKAKNVEGTHDHGEGSLSSWGSGEDGKAVEEYEYLNRFFQRYNKVFLDQQAIERERSRLDQENEDLRTILKQYLDGISINEDVINNPANPLIVVNNKLMLAQAARTQQVAEVRRRPSSAAGAVRPCQRQLIRQLIRRQRSAALEGGKHIIQISKTNTTRRIIYHHASVCVCVCVREIEMFMYVLFYIYKL